MENIVQKCTSCQKDFRIIVQEQEYYQKKNYLYQPAAQNVARRNVSCYAMNENYTNVLAINVIKQSFLLIQPIHRTWYTVKSVFGK